MLIKYRTQIIILVTGFWLLVTSASAQESLTITTFYPSPYGSYREMRAQRMAIGDGYIDGAQYCWPDETCTTTITTNADLVVEGNVGIGTTSPVSKLHIANVGLSDATTGLTLEGSWPWTFYKDTESNQNSWVNYADGSNYYLKEIAYADRNNSSLYAVGDIRLTVKAGGNVGIGHTTPSVPLTVSKSSAGEIVTVAEFINPGYTSDWTSGAALRIGGIYTESSTADYSSRIVGYHNSATYGSRLQLQTRSASQTWNTGIMIDHAGDVGIGTTSPVSKLHIANVGLSDATTGLTLEGSWPWTFYKDTESNQNSWVNYADGSNYYLKEIAYADRNNSSLYAVGDIRLTVKAGGNVGIGTTSPGCKLDVTAGSTTWGGWYEAIRLSQSAHSAITHPGGGLLFGLHSNRNFYWADTINGWYSMWLDPNGNLTLRGTLAQSGCSRELKKDINYLSKNDYQDILKKVKNTKVVTYRFKTEDSHAKIHIGVIAEEAPEEIVGNDKRSINISDYLGFLMAAVKAQQQEIQALKQEVDRLTK